MDWPDNGGTMPSKSTPFTPSSILFRPRNQESGVSNRASGRIIAFRVLIPDS